MKEYRLGQQLKIEQQFSRTSGGKRNSVEFQITLISGRSNQSIRQTVFLSDDRI